MTRAQVIILSSQTLFAEGVASRLQQFPANVEVRIMDPLLPGTMAEISEVHPSAVILDATDLETDRYCPLCSLLSRIPELKVVRLDPHHNQVQIVTSKNLQAAEVRDLIGMLEIGG